MQPLKMFLDSRVYMNFRQVEVESGAVLKSIVRSKERSSADQNIWFIQVGGFENKNACKVYSSLPHLAISIQGDPSP